jgi:hypothetical protein
MQHMVDKIKGLPQVRSNTQRAPTPRGIHTFRDALYRQTRAQKKCRFFYKLDPQMEDHIQMTVVSLCICVTMQSNAELLCYLGQNGG